MFSKLKRAGAITKVLLVLGLIAAGGILSAAGLREAGAQTCTDADADGYYAEADCGTAVDCNDSLRSVNPGAAEVCNNVDDNCNGQVDEGNNWATVVGPTMISSNRGWPHIAVDASGNVHVVWRGPLYYTKLDSNGNTIVEDVELSSKFSFHSDPALDNNGNIHLAFIKSIRSNTDTIEFHYNKLDNNGSVLADNLIATLDYDSMGMPRKPQITVDNSGKVHIVWVWAKYTFEEDNRTSYVMRRVYYTKLDNNGNVLIENTRIASIGPMEYSAITSTGPTEHSVRLAVDNYGQPYIAWPGRHDIRCIKLDSHGQILLDNAILVSNRSDIASESLQMQIDKSGDFHFTWNSECRYPENVLYYTKLNSNRTVIMADTALASHVVIDYASPPCMKLDDAGNVHIFWRDSSYRPSPSEPRHTYVYYTKLDNAGNTLVGVTRMPSIYWYWGYRSMSLGVSNSGQAVHIMWQPKFWQPQPSNKA